MLPDLVSTQRVAGVDADADHVTGLEDVSGDRFEGLIGEEWRAERLRRRPRQDVEPARGDDADAERDVAGIDEVNTHGPSAIGRLFNCHRFERGNRGLGRRPW